MPQLSSAATYQGEPWRFFRCPYQAKVMKMLDSTSNRPACTPAGRDCRVCHMPICPQASKSSTAVSDSSARLVETNTLAVISSCATP